MKKWYKSPGDAEQTASVTGRTHNVREAGSLGANGDDDCLDAS